MGEHRVLSKKYLYNVLKAIFSTFVISETIQTMMITLSIFSTSGGGGDAKQEAKAKIAVRTEKQAAKEARRVAKEAEDKKLQEVTWQAYRVRGSGGGAGGVLRRILAIAGKDLSAHR